MTLRQARDWFAFLMAASRRRKLTAEERRILGVASQMIRYARRGTAKHNPFRYPKQKQAPRGIRISNPPTTIYGRLLRIEATKTQKHRCDASCKKAGHSYFHDFGPGAVIYGLADGSLLIRHRQGKRLWKNF